MTEGLLDRIGGLLIAIVAILSAIMFAIIGWTLATTVFFLFGWAVTIAMILQES